MVNIMLHVLQMIKWYWWTLPGEKIRPEKEVAVDPNTVVENSNEKDEVDGMTTLTS